MASNWHSPARTKTRQPAGRAEVSAFAKTSAFVKTTADEPAGRPAMFPPPLPLPYQRTGA